MLSYYIDQIERKLSRLKQDQFPELFREYDHVFETTLQDIALNRRLRVLNERLNQIVDDLNSK
jgi:hypothetical protein